MRRVARKIRIWMIWCALIAAAAFLMRYSNGAVIEGPYEGF
jgi:hypothetical protein